MNNLVSIHNGEARTTSLAIAEGTAVQHKAVIQLVRGYKTDLEEFGRVAFEMSPFNTAGGVQRREYATLNEPQATLIMTYMKNTPVVREFKKRLVRAFYEFSGNNAMLMNRINILEQRLSSLEHRRLSATRRNMSCTARAIRATGVTVTEWAASHGFLREEVSMHATGARMYPAIQALLEDEKIIPQKGGETMIDVKATNAMFDKKNINRAGWARSRGLNQATFYQRLNGHLAITPEIAELLRADGLLVEKN